MKEANKLLGFNSLCYLYTSLMKTEEEEKYTFSIVWILFL